MTGEFSGAKGLRARIYVYDVAARIGTPDERYGGFYPDRPLVAYLLDKREAQGDRKAGDVLRAAGL